MQKIYKAGFRNATGIQLMYYDAAFIAEIIRMHVDEVDMLNLTPDTHDFLQQFLSMAEEMQTR